MAETQQRMVRWRRLLLQDVDARAGDAAGLQGPGQCPVVHHRATCRVGFANGSVGLIGQEVDSRTLRALMTATGHDDEGIDPDSF